MSSKSSQVWKLALTPEQKAKVDEMDAELGRRISALQALRKELGLSQAELATILQTTQSNVSKLEAGRELRINTLKTLVESQGGHLKVVAEFDGREIELAL